MGMTLKEYWDGDPKDAAIIREAHDLRRKNDNFNAWLQGQYIYEALLCASPMFHDWVKRPKPIPYPKKPYELFEKAEKKTESDDKELKNQATIRAWVDRANRIREQKDKKEGKANG